MSRCGSSSGKHGEVHRPVSEEVHLSAVAVDYDVMALQGAGGVSIKPNIMLTSTLTSIASKHWILLWMVIIV